MPRSAKPTPEKRCEICTAPMRRKRSKRGVLEDFGAFMRRRFCSLSCANSREKGGTSSTTFHRRAGKARKPVCERCSRSHPKLHVHHQDENPSNNSPGNLKTLCPSCHKLLHLEQSKTG